MENKAFIEVVSDLGKKVDAAITVIDIFLSFFLFACQPQLTSLGKSQDLAEHWKGVVGQVVHSSETKLVTSIEVLRYTLTHHWNLLQHLIILFDIC